MAAQEAHTNNKKIKAPVLAIAVIGFPTNMVEHVQTMPEPRRKVVNEFLRALSAVKEKETIRFREKLPTAQLVTLTNTNHACFIDREDDVPREMREFLSR